MLEQEEKIDEKQIEEEFPASGELLSCLGIAKDRDGKLLIEEEKPLPLYTKEFFAQLLTSGDKSLTDVYFDCGDEKNRQSVGAHRFILALASPLFEAMLYVDSELTPDRKLELPLRIKLKNIKASAFQVFLKAIYTDVVEVKADTISDLMQLANRFQIEKIQRACSEFLSNGLTAENVCAMLQVAPQLATGAAFQRIMEESAEDVLKSAAFLTLNPETLTTLLQSSSLPVPEIDIFNAFVRWADEESKRQNKSKKEVCKSAVKYIRFPLLTPTQVAINVTKSGVLEEEDLFRLYGYISLNSVELKGKIKIPYSTKPRQEPGGSFPPPVEGDIYGKNMNGIFWAIGTSYGKHPFFNPMVLGEVEVTHDPTGSWSGGTAFGDKDIVAGLKTGEAISTDINISGMWIQFDLKNWRVSPTHYVMKNGGGRGLVLKDWNIEAKVDEKSEWKQLYVHKNDQIYNSDNKGGFGIHVFAFPPPTGKKTHEFFQYFRILRTDTSKNIYIHRFELYGQLKRLKAPVAKKIPKDNYTFKCHPHPLSYKLPYPTSGGGFNCDICRATYPAAIESWHCDPCRYDLCSGCSATHL